MLCCLCIFHAKIVKGKNSGCCCRRVEPSLARLSWGVVFRAAVGGARPQGEMQSFFNSLWDTFSHHTQWQNKQDLWWLEDGQLLGQKRINKSPSIEPIRARESRAPSDSSHGGLENLINKWSTWSRAGLWPFGPSDSMCPSLQSTYSHTIVPIFLSRIQWNRSVLAVKHSGHFMSPEKFGPYKWFLKSNFA